MAYYNIWAHIDQKPFSKPTYPHLDKWKVPCVWLYPLSLLGLTKQRKEKETKTDVNTLFNCWGYQTGQWPLGHCTNNKHHYRGLYGKHWRECLVMIFNVRTNSNLRPLQQLHLPRWSIPRSPTQPPGRPCVCAGACSLTTRWSTTSSTTDPCWRTHRQTAAACHLVRHGTARHARRTRWMTTPTTVRVVQRSDRPPVDSFPDIWRRCALAFQCAR